MSSNEIYPNSIEFYGNHLDRININVYREVLENWTLLATKTDTWNIFANSNLRNPDDDTPYNVANIWAKGSDLKEASSLFEKQYNLLMKMYEEIKENIGGNYYSFFTGFPEKFSENIHFQTRVFRSDWIIYAQSRHAPSLALDPCGVYLHIVANAKSLNEAISSFEVEHKSFNAKIEELEKILGKK